MKKYFRHRLEHLVEVSRVITIHHFEFAKDFHTQGEAHDFWELVYADREEILCTAIATIKVRATVDEIVQLEGLEATQEEIGEALVMIARQNRMTVEQLKPHYDAEFEKAVIRSVLTAKVMKLIRDAAVIEE